MIIDLHRFISEAQPRWQELEELLDSLQRRGARLSPGQAFRLHELYECALSDMAQVATFAAEQSTHDYLGRLTARAYAEIHETRSRRDGVRLHPWQWLTRTLPQTFRRRRKAFIIALLATLVGSLLGAGAITMDPGAKDTLMPFDHLLGDPSDRVAQEEADPDDPYRGRYASGSAWYMTHNTRVSILTLALGATYGLGTLIMLFYNGVILGAVTADYLVSGEGVFLTGWLLPHGSVEIPAIVIAGQAGLALAGAMIGDRSRLPMRDRLRAVLPDLVTLSGGFALLLVWAGIVEACFSQFHAPVLPYSAKITFGAVQFVLLCAYLARCGRKSPGEGEDAPGRH
jgi:uncharacterized membrane protein SpoIIM required for sporulation